MLMITEDRRDADEARRSVNDALGARCQTLAMDSLAEDLYADALDQMGIDHKGITSTPALRKLFNRALEQRHKTKSRVAFDSSDVAAAEIYARALDHLKIKYESASVEEMRNLFAAAMKLDRNKISDADLLEIAELVPNSLDHMHAPPAFDSKLAREFPNAARQIRIL